MYLTKSIPPAADGSVVYNDHSAGKNHGTGIGKRKSRNAAGAPRAKLTCYAEEEGSFIDSLERLARHKEASLIIMGITGATRLCPDFYWQQYLEHGKQEYLPCHDCSTRCIYLPVLKRGVYLRFQRC